MCAWKMLIHFNLVNIMLKLLYYTELCRNSVLEKMMKFDKKPIIFGQFVTYHPHRFQSLLLADAHEV